MGRAARGYLDLLRDALLDEHYLEHELRIEHLLRCVAGKEDLDPDKLANPTRYMAAPLRRLKQERQAGELSGDGTRAAVLSYAPQGRVRLDHLRACLETIRGEGVAGDLVDCGTAPGGAAIFMRGFLEAYELAGPRVWAADRFDAFADLTTVRETFARFALLDERVVFLEGPLPRTIPDAAIGEIALLRLASEDPEDARAVLETLYERISPGGIVVVDAYARDDCQAAVEGFRSARAISEPVERIDWMAAAWRKSTQHHRRRARPSAAKPTRTRDLSVVVVAYNMRREAARTLHSLSRAYQRRIDSLDYEVVVVENGSAADQKLGEALVRSYGAEFRYIDLGDETSSSPAPAVNRGIAASTGRNVAVMIDGAHVVTPGVLYYGMLGLSSYEPAVVTAKQWYVGPGQQPQAVAGGYDRDIEDRLFAEINWPQDGYRLFEIGHFIGDRDWLDGEWESNCMFVPRNLIEQAGGMDESFSEPGGGFVNLDFFERMVGCPGVTQVTMLGEGSFHQVHGGTTTNEGEPAELIRSYEEQYEQLRGRRFRIPGQRIHYVGSIPPTARRIKARQMDSFRHFGDAHIEARGRRPSRPVPVPQDLKVEFIDAFWRSDGWHRATWLGKAVHRAPTDLFVYQELVWRVKPDWVIETRTGTGGRALFLASICDLVGSGQIVSIDRYPVGDVPEHPRITHLRADPTTDAAAAKVSELLGADSRALVILGGTSGSEVVRAFQRYSPFVPIGSYVVVEDTIFGGNPVWPHFGPGPASAVNDIVDERRFVPDPALEHLALTFNIGGFLRRIR